MPLPFPELSSRAPVPPKLVTCACAEPHSPGALKSRDGALLAALMASACNPAMHARVPGFTLITRDPNHLQHGSVCSLFSVLPEVIPFSLPDGERGACISRIKDRAMSGVCLERPHRKALHVPFSEMPCGCAEVAGQLLCKGEC